MKVTTNFGEGDSHAVTGFGVDHGGGGFEEIRPGENLDEDLNAGG